MSGCLTTGWIIKAQNNNREHPQEVSKPVNVPLKTEKYKQMDGVKVYIVTPDEKDGFHHAVCWLSEYKWEDIIGYDNQALSRYKEVCKEERTFNYGI